MMAFPKMLVPSAERAGMKVPPDPDNYTKKEYPHFWVFAVCQLGAPMPYPGVVWDNAQVVAGLSDDEILEISYEQLIERGFQVGNSSVYM